MNCNNCGQALPQDSTLCANCGHLNSSQQQDSSFSQSTQSNFNTGFDSSFSNPVPPPKKNPAFLIIAAVVAVVAIAGLSFGAFTLFQTLTATPKQVYIDAENKYFTQKMSESKNQLEKITENKIEIKATADLPSQSLSPVYSSMITGLLNQSKVLITAKNNPSKEKSQVDLDFVLGGSSFVKGMFFADKKIVGVSVPDIYPKTVALDVTKIKNVMQKFGIPQSSTIPDNFFSPQTDKAKKIIDDIESKKLFEPYKKIYFDSIEDKNISVQKDAKYTLNGEEVSCTKYDIKFDEKMLKDLLYKFMEQLSKDDQLIDFVLELSKSSASNSTTKIPTKDEIKKEIKDALPKLKEGLDKQSDLGLSDFSMTLWMDGRTIIGRKLSISMNDKTSNEKFTFDVNFSDWKNKKDDSTGGLIQLTLKGKFLKAQNINDDVSMSLNFKYDSKNISDFTVPALGSNVVQLDALKEDEMINFTQDITKSFQTWIMKKQQLLSSFIK